MRPPFLRSYPIGVTIWDKTNHGNTNTDFFLNLLKFKTTEQQQDQDHSGEQCGLVRVVCSLPNF